MEEKETLGKYLKSQRESKKISLNEVAKNTRVREPILRALEEDQHHLLPPATYVKGFLLAYAKYLGLDLNDILLRYERALKGESIAPPSMPPPEPEQENLPPQTLRPKQKTRWNMKQIGVVAGVIVASLVVFHLFSPYPGKAPIETSLEKGAEEKSSIPPSPPIAAPAPAPEVEPPVQEKNPLTPSAPVTAAPPVQEKKAVSLELKAVEETWLSLQADDQSVKEMIFKPGEGTTFQASGRILMRLGNAGGLDLTLNGKPLRKLGKSGEVLNLVVTPQGVEVKRPERPKPPDEGISKSESQSSN